MLDDEDMPLEAISLAVRIATLIQNPAAPKAISYILSKDPNAFKISANCSQREKWAEIIKNTRPDLIEAFYTSMVAGMAAFVGRWPECRPAFDGILVDFVASPVAGCRG